MNKKFNQRRTMRLEKIEGKSKKTGKPYVGYCVTIGEYRTPIFFPSKVELIYIEQQLKKSAHKDYNQEWCSFGDFSP